MGNIDIYHSRRTNYEECWYWVRDERASAGDLSQWILKNKTSGMFYAKEVNPVFNQENPVANAMMFDKNTISIETDDDIDDLKRGCIVLYDGKPWVVDSVQQLLHRKESEFSNIKHYKTIINMRH